MRKGGRQKMKQIVIGDERSLLVRLQCRYKTGTRDAHTAAADHNANASYTLPLQHSGRHVENTHEFFNMSTHGYPKDTYSNILSDSFEAPIHLAPTK